MTSVSEAVVKIDKSQFIKVAVAAMKNTSVHLTRCQSEALKNYIWKQELSRQGGILADEMGSGKTYTMCATIATNPMGRTLLLVPVSLLGQWEDALSKWNLTYVTVNNPDTSFPRTGSSSATRVFLATHSCLARTPMHVFYTKVQWDRVIVDEAHVLRNPMSSTHQNAMLLMARVRWAVTATPIQNTIDDLVSLAKFIRAPNPEDTKEVIEKYMLRRTMKQIEDRGGKPIPPLISLYQVFDLSPVGAAIYAKITKMTQKTKHKTRAYAMARIVRQRLCCLDPTLALQAMAKIKPSKAARQPADVRSPKIEWLVQDLLKLPKDTKSLIFCTWTSEIELIRATLTHVGLKVLVFDGKLDFNKRSDVLSNFKLPGFDVLILQILCGSVGLNIQHATRVYITCPSWNPTTEMQAIARTHRQGQNKVVTCIRLVTKGTIEEPIMYTQLRKSRLIKAVTKDDSVAERLLLTDDGLQFLAGGQGITRYEEMLDESGLTPDPLSMTAKRRRIGAIPTDDSEGVIGNVATDVPTITAHDTSKAYTPPIKKLTKAKAKAMANAEQRRENANRIERLRTAIYV